MTGPSIESLTCILEDERARERTRADKAEATLAEMKDVAEYLWAVVANVSGGDWTKQSEEWQRAASRARDQYNKTISIDCGKGWVRVESLDLEKTINVFRKLTECLIGTWSSWLREDCSREADRLEALVKGAEK